MGFIAIMLFHQPMPSRPGFETEAAGYTLKKKGGNVKTVHWLQTARVTQSGDVQNDVDFFQWPLSLPQYSRVYILVLHYNLSSLV